MPPKTPQFTPRMAYSGATRMMRRLFWTHLESDRTGVPVDELLGQQEETARIQRQQGVSRRDFLRLAGGGAAAALAAGLRPGRALAATPQVAIVGAGLAGMRCADKLAQHGIAATVYEAANRIGGRTFTDTTTFPGQVAEHGGSFISTEHNSMRNLVNNLGLSLEVVNGGAMLDGEEIYYIDGQFYTFQQANDDWRVAWKAFKEELHDAPWPQTFDAFTTRGQELDNIPVPAWFDPASPYSHPILAGFGPDSNFARLCYSDCVVEYGGDPEAQPALNLLYLLAWNPKGSVTPLPGTDEYYHVVGGNQQVALTLASMLPTPVQLNKALEAITGDFNGPYTLHFEDGTTAGADKLVLALPFSILREVDIDPRIWDGFRPEKRLAIEQMPIGSNAKIHLELADRTWGPGKEQTIYGQEMLLNGVAYSEPDGFQCLWDDSVPRESGPVLMVNYLGGAQGAGLNGSGGPFGPAHQTDVNRALSRADEVFPGTSAAYTGTSLKSFWAADPWHKGAYSFWSIGGYTTYVGAAALPEGNIHFCGEHTSVEYQGFMEGAVTSGRRAADEVRMSI